MFRLTILSLLMVLFAHVSMASPLTEEEKKSTLGRITELGAVQQACDEDSGKYQSLIRRYVFMMQIQSDGLKDLVKDSARKGVEEQKSQQISCEKASTLLEQINDDFRKDHHENMIEVAKMVSAITGAATTCGKKSEETDPLIEKILKFTNVENISSMEEWKNQGKTQVKNNSISCDRVITIFDSVNSMF